MSYFALGIFALPSNLEDSQDSLDIEDGFHRYDDMILDDVQDRILRNDDTELDRNAIKGEKYRWPKGVIPYKTDEATVDDYMKEWLKEYAEKFNKQMEGCLTIRWVLESLLQEPDWKVYFWPKLKFWGLKID